MSLYVSYVMTLCFYLDIDECMTVSSHDCEQNCDNILGGYVCTCNEGFNLNTTDNKTCEGKLYIMICCKTRLVSNRVQVFLCRHKRFIQFHIFGYRNDVMPQQLVCTNYMAVISIMSNVSLWTRYRIIYIYACYNNSSMLTNVWPKISHNL